MTLQEQYEKETGEKAINSQEEYDIDYVHWLENKIKHLQDSAQKCLDTLGKYGI